MPTRRAPRRRTAAVNTERLNPALTELLRQIATADAAADQTVSADAVSRVPGTRTACLSPAQMLHLGARRAPHPVGLDDRALWCSAAPVTVLKEGVAFNNAKWFHPILLTMVAGDKDTARADFILLYDRAALASDTLTEVHLYQKFGTDDRTFIATLHEKTRAAASLDIEQFIKAREQETAQIYEQRAAAQQGYAGLVIGPEAVEEHRQREAARAASAAMRKPEARVAKPISATARAQARRQAQEDELYAREAKPVATPRPRRPRIDPLDGVRAADVTPQAVPTAAPAGSASSSAAAESAEADDVMPTPRSSRSRR